MRLGNSELCSYLGIYIHPCNMFEKDILSIRMIGFGRLSEYVILSWETLDNPYFVYSELYLSLLSSVRFSFSIMNFINLMYFNFSIIKFKFQYLWLSFNIFIVFSVRYLHKWEIKYFKAITMILFSLVSDHGKILRKETFSLAFSIMTKPDVTIIKSGIIFISCLKSKDRDIHYSRNFFLVQRRFG